MQSQDPWALHSHSCPASDHGLFFLLKQMADFHTCTITLQLYIMIDNYDMGKAYFIKLLSQTKNLVKAKKPPHKKNNLKACWCYSFSEYSTDILCKPHDAIHFQHLRCVLCTHRHHIVPLGAANRFVWPGSLFCLSLCALLNSYPLPAPCPTTRY